VPISTGFVAILNAHFDEVVRSQQLGAAGALNIVLKPRLSAMHCSKNFLNRLRFDQVMIKNMFDVF